jgi:hypothetical protein
MSAGPARRLPVSCLAVHPLGGIRLPVGLEVSAGGATESRDHDARPPVQDLESQPALIRLPREPALPGDPCEGVVGNVPFLHFASALRAC